MKLFKFKIVFVLLIMVIASDAQEFYNFKRLSKENGLSQSSVFAIAEDVDGFFWFGTRDGLNKYDGNDMTIIKSSDTDGGLPSNDIRSLYPDPVTGNLWIGTIEGLSLYHRDTETFQNFQNQNDTGSSISGSSVRTILKFDEDELLVGTYAGLNILDENTGMVKDFKLPGNDLANTIEVLYKDKLGLTWIGTHDGLFILNYSNGNFSFTRKDIALGITNSYITAIEEDDFGNLWIGTNGDGVFIFNPDHELHKRLFKDAEPNHRLINDQIRAIEQDKNGNIWVGTFLGITVYNKLIQNERNYQKTDEIKRGLSDNSIKAILCDSKGSIWIGSYYGGVNHLDENYNKFQNFIYTSHPKGLSAEVVSSFAEDKNGNLWIGTEGGGLNYYDRRSKTYKYYTSSENKDISLAGMNVKQLLLAGDTLWIGTFNNGFNLLHIKTEKFEHFSHNPEISNGLTDNNVYDFLLKDNQLWIATFGGGVNIMDLKTKEFRSFKQNSVAVNPISSDQVRVILETKNGEIWVGTSRGINKVALDNNGLPRSFQNWIPEERIYALQESSDHFLYIGTISSGLFRFNLETEEIERFTIKEGLAGNTVYGILEDENHFIWLSTNNGLSRLNPQTKKIINFNNSNGLYNSEFNFNAYYKTASGELLFGGINGYTRFDPNTIKINEFIPKVVFTDLIKNNASVSISKDGILRSAINQTDKIVFPYNEANFTLKFAALDFFSPENNHYAYKLEGIDRDWIYTIGDPTATYTIQNHGNYTFRLKGANSDGIWNENERKLSIVVLPPPWKTWWAYLLYFMVGAVTIYSLYRYLKLRASYKYERLEKQKQEELLEMKMRFYTNITHEFRTPLTLIIGPLKDLIGEEWISNNPLIKQRVEKIYSHAQRMLNLVNQLMTFRKIESGHEPLEVQEVEMNSFMAEIFTKFSDFAKKNQINYSIDLPEDVIFLWIDKEKLTKVIMNLLANSFKFTEENGNISLIMKEDRNKVKIIVKDNGIGIPENLHEQIFQRFYEKNIQTKRSVIKGTGIGLSLSKQMIELHKGSISVDSKENEGATFEINLLKGKKHFDSDSIIIDKVDKIESAFVENQQAFHEFKVDNTDSPAIIPSLITNPNTKILVVDDNEEILDYYQSIFFGDYKIIRATQGAEALEKLAKYAPDLIICDVMMPVMDGITFCKTVRSDFNISHIPILLVTAKANDEDRLNGLELGANDYITKPFDAHALKFKVRNILQQRKLLLQKLQNPGQFTPSEVQVTSSDEAFLQNLINLVEENISNSDFNIELFASELAVSRSLLFTKVKGLTNMTPKNFVKHFRLKRAVQLLETNKLSIAQIAYEVGFTDAKYFSKVFQKEFGMTPSEFEVELN